ncbi:MAG TPA: SDR family NAD(P)-dependent oxidoreductase, partial [Propionibacteriaceae bacterium]|nr:SDR family NAD(P)-dependent oxidoreductase [Propionibacteriaceae bacterium]
MSQRFTGRTVLVTGSASGIGAQTVRRFAAEGASVVVADRNEAG